ncbi:TnsA-like heteromeric transposase endonuclease subunit [Mycobacteroides chelonae]|uniref:TnsA-like heteromeric transposase endonuclease subunit n=1 Tax=Mycobacteroides chelonae TaxID=1774 RepID=UPI0009924504|nr:TnsA-like heteromeric transposase endonuclease subunit [Mycobacteroides chelonae]
MGSTMRKLPVNVTDRERLLFCIHNAVQNADVSPHLVDEPLERAQPIRDFFAWQGKRNYEGLWWSSTAGGHIPFESLLEREYLLAADFDPHAVAIAAQPLAILWPHRTPGNTSHTPDFFVRLADSDGLIVDVRHPDRVDSASRQSELTRQLCDQIGWRYQVFTGMPTVLAANLRWLSGYRHDRHTPNGAVRDALLASFTEPAPLRAGILRASTAAATDLNVVTSNAFHLLWRRTLRVDLDRVLSSESQVSA